MSDHQVTGRAKIRVDGTLLETMPGATLDIGGIRRKTVVGAIKVIGYQEEPAPAVLDCRIAHQKKVSVTALGALNDTTITFETDTGKLYMLRHAFSTDTPKVDSGSGEVTLKFEAPACDEV